jgi:hypothetical protein
MLHVFAAWHLVHVQYPCCLLCWTLLLLLVWLLLVLAAYRGAR